MSDVSYLDLLEKGHDANQVMEIMSADEIWDNFETLVSHGANINITELMYRLGIFFAMEHWDELVERGALPDELAKWCYEGIVDDDDDIKFLLHKKVSPEVVLELAEDMMGLAKYFPDDCYDTFSLLIEYGLSNSKMNEWISDHLSDAMINSIVDEDTENWRELGVNPDGFIGPWLDCHGDAFFWGQSLRELPGIITLKDFIDHYSAAEIVEYSRYYGFIDFVNDYIENGGDIDYLGRKFAGEITNYDEKDTIEAMLALVWGGTTEIDLQDLVETEGFEDLSRSAKASWYEDLLNAGFDEQSLAKFRSRS